MCVCVCELYVDNVIRDTPFIKILIECLVYLLPPQRGQPYYQGKNMMVTIVFSFRGSIVHVCMKLSDCFSYVGT